MMSFTLMAALLFSRLSVSVSEFHTVDAQPGEEVTLLCSNFTSVPLHIAWFRLNSTSNMSRISSMSIAGGNVSFYDEFQNGSFDMASNSTHLFLRMKQVDCCHSGIYFCGFNSEINPVIVSATYLKVQEAFIEIDTYLNMILGALVVLLSVVVFTLVVIIRKLHEAREEEQDPPQSENVASDDVNYAALRFQPKAGSSRRPAAEQELETQSVLYSTTRVTF